jgi:hypothetical protein
LEEPLLAHAIAAVVLRHSNPALCGLLDHCTVASC